MVLRHLSEGQAAGILQALSGQGYGFVADNNRDAARQIMADTDSQALASLASRPARRPDSTAVQVVDVDSRIVPEFKRARDLAKWLKA